MCLPGRMGGNTWHDLMGLNHGALTSMGNTSNGWRGTTRPGGFGHLLFDGTAGYVQVGDRAALNLTTVGAVGMWAYALKSLAAGDGVYVCKGNIFNDLNSYGIFSYHNTGWAFEIASGAASNRVAVGTGNYVQNAWTHLMMAWDGSNLRGYVNGKKVGTQAQTINASPSGTPCRFGANGNTAPSDYTNILADDIRIYSRALSDSEVFAAYTDSLTGTYAALNRVGP